MGRSYDRSIRLDLVTNERIKNSAAKQAISVSAWIRVAIKQQLEGDDTKSEVSQLRDELAPNFTRILDQCRSLSNAQQTAIAMVDTLTKYILSVSPEPGADAGKLGRRRYEKFLKTVAAALNGGQERAFPCVDGSDQDPQPGSSSPRRWKQ